MQLTYDILSRKTFHILYICIYINILDKSIYLYIRYIYIYSIIHND